MPYSNDPKLNIDILFVKRMHHYHDEHVTDLHHHVVCMSTWAGLIVSLITSLGQASSWSRSGQLDDERCVASYRWSSFVVSTVGGFIYSDYIRWVQSLIGIWIARLLFLSGVKFQLRKRPLLSLMFHEHNQNDWTESCSQVKQLPQQSAPKSQRESNSGTLC